tara:strand:- start:1477 stop:1776 length:300 start_codon:yes stop_codon:yes gene_type:complete
MSEIISNQYLPDGEEPPKIIFPCDYLIKIIGDAEPDFIDVVVAIVCRHAADFDPATVNSRDSSKGKFRSVAVNIIATGEPQLENLFADLKATGRVKMVI